VILSAALPSRLLNAFPVGVPILRVTLDEAVARITREDSHKSGIDLTDSPLFSANALGHQDPE